MMAVTKRTPPRVEVKPWLKTAQWWVTWILGHGLIGMLFK